MGGLYSDNSESNHEYQKISDTDANGTISPLTPDGNIFRVIDMKTHVAHKNINKFNHRFTKDPSKIKKITEHFPTLFIMSSDALDKNNMTSYSTKFNMILQQDSKIVTCLVTDLDVREIYYFEEIKMNDIKQPSKIELYIKTFVKINFDGIDFYTSLTKTITKLDKILLPEKVTVQRLTEIKIYDSLQSLIEVELDSKKKDIQASLTKYMHFQSRLK